MRQLDVVTDQQIEIVAIHDRVYFVVEHDDRHSAQARGAIATVQD